MDRVLAVLLLPLVGLATTSSSACTFQLHYQVCLQHGVVNTTRDCDTLTTGLEAEFGASSSVRFHTRGLTWTGGQVDELEATAHLNEGSFKYSGIKENLSGLGKDLVRGISRLLLAGNAPTLSNHACSSRLIHSGNGRDKTRVQCTGGSKQHQPIHHVHQLHTERDTLVDESGLVREAEVRETVLYYLNLDRRLATQVSTTISLHRKENCHRLDEDIPLEDGDKDDLSVIEPPTENKEKLSVDSILKEKNVITLVHKLKLVMSKMSYEEVSSLLKKHRRSDRLAYIMEAAGSSGAHHVFRAVQKIFPFQQKQHSGLVERYLIALSYAPAVEDGLLGEINSFLVGLKASNRHGVGETALYCLCKQYGLKNKRREEVRALLELADRFHCSTAGYCNLQPVMLCTHALSSGDEYTTEMLDLMEKSKKGEVETGASHLAAGLPGYQDRVTALLHDATSNNAFFKILNLVDLTALNQSSITELMQTKDTERRSYIAKRLSYQVDSARRDYSLQAYALQGKSVYVEGGLAGDAGSGGGFQFSSTAGGGGAVSRTSFSLNLVDALLHKRQLISIQSFIGGLSSLMGEGGGDSDDEEASASVQITLLGLPLRPLVLFSSVGDLINLYWSGAGQQKTTLLEGSVPLDEDTVAWESYGGLRLRFQARLGLHILSAGEGSVSIWDSSGSGSLETGVRVAGSTGVHLLAPTSSAFITANLDVSTALTMHTQMELGSELVCCVRMMSSSLDVAVELAARDGTTARTLSYPGLTWNINHDNNRACSYFK